MAKFMMVETVDTAEIETARLGAGTGPANVLSDKDAGKFVKLVAESRYDLAAAGDQLEGRITSVEASTVDGYSLGGVMSEGSFAVTFDGLQATPGTGVVAIGDFVVVGTTVAKGTPLTAAAKVCKATAAGNTLNFKWRVVSLGAAGTGAVGTTGLIDLVG